MFFSNRPRPSRDGDREPKRLTAENKRQLLAMGIMTALLMLIYFGCIGIATAMPGRYAFLVPLVMGVYMVAFAVLLVAYLLYNRAFVNKNVTVDMLPADWSEEKKQAFVDDVKDRADRSRWMLVLIIPFVVVFMVEALYLFVWNGWLGDLLGRGG